MKKLKVALIFGTRPEIIKLSSLMRLFQKKKTPYFMIHTGQHYSPLMDDIFFRELKLPKPKYKLSLRSKAAFLQGDHTGRMLIAIEKILIKENPTHVLVQGDTNTVLAGSLASSKISTTQSYTGYRYLLGHVEAGLRSFDRAMPEEINRFISDHLSDLCFAPTPQSKKHLLREGVGARKIFVTGNTIVDALSQNLRLAKRAVNAGRLFRSIGLGRGDVETGYLLVTLHRQENVDDKKRLLEILKGIVMASRRLGQKVIFPMHPRTRGKFLAFGIDIPEEILVTEPVGFLDFLVLEANASLIMTDSGGVQEEACILKVPCITLRTTTERPETIRAGANVLAGIRGAKILKSSQSMISKKRSWQNPYGDGRTAEKILAILKRSLNGNRS